MTFVGVWLPMNKNSLKIAGQARNDKFNVWAQNLKLLLCFNTMLIQQLRHHVLGMMAVLHIYGGFRGN